MNKTKKRWWTFLPSFYFVRLTNGQAYSVPGWSKDDAIERVLLNNGISREHIQSCVVDVSK